MKYKVNGKILNRNELIEKVYNTCLDLGQEKSPLMTYRWIKKFHTVEEKRRLSNIIAKNMLAKLRIL